MRLIYSCQAAPSVTHTCKKIVRFSQIGTNVSLTVTLNINLVCDKSYGRVVRIKIKNNWPGGRIGESADPACSRDYLWRLLIGLQFSNL